jgi:site-specific recombinase XerD
MDIQEMIAKCKRSVFLDRAKSTAKNYNCGLRVFSHYLESCDLSPTLSISCLTTDHFIRFPGWLLENSSSNKVAAVYLSAMKYLLDKMVIEGYIEPTYSETIRLKQAMEACRKKRERVLPHTPPKGAIEKMIAAGHQINEPSPRKERDLALILFLATSGCRNEEVTHLSIKDLDLAERSAIVIGKGSKERKAFFSQETVEALRQYWSSRGSAEKSNPVFARHDKGAGKKILPLSTTTVRDIVHQVALIAGVENFIPHQFRHGFAITMLHETGNLALVQDLLGHASPNTTRVYAKIYPEELREAHREVFR